MGEFARFDLIRPVLTNNLASTHVSWRTVRKALRTIRSSATRMNEPSLFTFP